MFEMDDLAKPNKSAWLWYNECSSITLHSLSNNPFSFLRYLCCAAVLSSIVFLHSLLLCRDVFDAKLSIPMTFVADIVPKRKLGGSGGPEGRSGAERGGSGGSDICERLDCGDGEKYDAATLCGEEDEGSVACEARLAPSPLSLHGMECACTWRQAKSMSSKIVRHYFPKVTPQEVALCPRAHPSLHQPNARLHLKRSFAACTCAGPRRANQVRVGTVRDE